MAHPLKHSEISILRAVRKSSAASPKTTCPFTTGSTNRKRSSQPSVIVRFVITQKVSSWPRRCSGWRSEIVKVNRFQCGT